MESTHHWTLTIRFWPQATAAGVQPREVGMYDDVEGKDPAAYQPTTLVFAHRPTRADFIEVVNQTPWMAACWLKPKYEGTLLDVISKNQWPLPSDHHKAAEVHLLDVNGKTVGLLEVRKKVVYSNPSRWIPTVWLLKAQEVVDRRFRKPHREAAMQYLRDREHLIQENVMKNMDWNEYSVIEEMGRQLLQFKKTLTTTEKTNEVLTKATK